MTFLKIFIITCVFVAATFGHSNEEYDDYSCVNNPTCPVNEVSLSVPSCPPEQTCASFLSGILYPCARPPQESYTDECRCAEGFIRKEAGGECVKNCCDDPNAEVVSCPSPCPGGTCEQPEFSPCRRACPLRGCQCKKGFVKNNSGKCIPLKKCPKPKCKKNEVSILVRPCPPEQTCASYMSGNLYPCARPLPGSSKEECRCAEGFIRKTAGSECVKINSCCDDPNAEVVSCPNTCPGGTCEQPEISPCKIVCTRRKGCQCKKGFVKNKNGKCIPLNKCPNTKCKKNEVSKLVFPCPPEDTCASYLSGKNYRCGRPLPGSSKEQCRCAEGFIRDKEGGECVKINNCCDDPNVEVVSCPSPCPGGTCENPEFAPCKAACKIRGCQCKKGFVKDVNGKCIQLNQCPKCTKKNQVYKSCGTRCPPTCANPNPICVEVCEPGCFCKEGFILNDAGECIPKSECPVSVHVSDPTPCQDSSPSQPADAVSS